MTGIGSIGPSSGKELSMPTGRFERIAESGVFEWPWPSRQDLLVIRGAAGGGGGGYATSVQYEQTLWKAHGGNGGGDGGGGGLDGGKPVAGPQGIGCLHGDGGDGGQGGNAPSADGRVASNGGDGGKGFPGETRIVEPGDRSVGDRFQIDVGAGGEGGGEGYPTDVAGGNGAGGFVLFVPLHQDKTGDE